MAQRGRFRRLSLDHKLQFWSIVVGAVAAVATGIVVPIALSGGSDPSSSARIGTNNGQINIGGTVNNYPAQSTAADPNPNGPSVQSDTCPVHKSKQKGSVDTLAVDLLVRPYQNGECWATSSTLGLTPSTVEYEIRYTNTSDVVQKDVIFGVRLPKGLQMVPGTTFIRNSNYSKGKQIDTDAVDSTGIILGSYAPGANAYVTFEAQTPAVGDLKCGRNVLRTIASVQPKGLDYFYNTADVNLTRNCTPLSSSSH